MVVDPENITPLHFARPIVVKDDRGNTTIIQDLLQQLKAGDTSAQEELIRISMQRLERLARKMLRANPAVKRWNQTDDVLQNALIRLQRALKTERPDTTRRFIGLAATQIRRELIDLWRHHFGPQGDGSHHLSNVAANDDSAPSDLHAPVSPIASNPEFRLPVLEAVDSLDPSLQEIVHMRTYLGMTHDEIAEAVGVSVKTSKRRWREAKLQLAELLRDN